ncbi:MAG: radical SAM protein [Nitrospirae bacterium]|nr:radical SAM protein [Nitrospirota bacterium]
MNFHLPQYIQLYPTVRCNQRCSFCFNGDSPKMPDLAFEDALKLIGVLSSHNVMEIDLMGGEPLLLEWVPDFIKTCTGRGFLVNVSTNGSVPGALPGLTGVDPSRFNIGVSLEGGTEARHNKITRSSNFGRAVESLVKLSEMGLDPLVKTVLNRETERDIQNIIALLNRLGIRRYYLIHMDVFSSDPAQAASAFGYPRFMSAFKTLKEANPGMDISCVTASCFNSGGAAPGLRCAGGSKKVSIQPDGSVFPCNLFHGFPEFRIGNILEDDLAHIMKHPRFDYFRTFNGNTCPERRCSNRGPCTGGCPAHRYFHYRELDGPDIRCLSLDSLC